MRSRRGRKESGTPLAPPIRPPAPLVSTPPPLPGVVRGATPWIVSAVPDFTSRRELRETRARADPAPGFRLVFSTGQVLHVRGHGVVGRSPRTGDYAHRVTIPDPTRSISRSHFEFGVTPAGALWACDLDSGNGTRLVRADGEEALVADRRVALSHGSVLRFGDHSMAVERT